MNNSIRFLPIVFLIAGIGVGILFSPISRTVAQPLVEAVSLPVAESLILEYINGATTVVQEVMKVGNVPLGDGLVVMAPLSDTAYYRAHLTFDLAPIPSGATVTQALFVFRVDRFEYPYPSLPDPGASISCGLYAVSEPWQPASTWEWGQNPSIVTETARSIPLVFNHTGAYTVEVTDLVQAWEGGSANHGMLMGMYPDPDLRAPFTAVLHGPAAISETLRPQLHVLYEPRTTPWLVYLPLVPHRYDLRPDLVVDIVRPINHAAPEAFQIVVTNRGLRAAHDFWVDVYLDPLHPPEANQPWPNLCEFYGATWQIPTLEAGESLALTIEDAYYGALYSQWPQGSYPSGGHAVWAYIDSWSDQPWGWVQEANEENNRDGPVTFTVTGDVQAGASLSPLEVFLPRP